MTSSLAAVERQEKSFDCRNLRQQQDTHPMLQSQDIQMCVFSSLALKCMYVRNVDIYTCTHVFLDDYIARTCCLKKHIRASRMVAVGCLRVNGSVVGRVESGGVCIYIFLWQTKLVNFKPSVRIVVECVERQARGMHTTPVRQSQTLPTLVLAG